MAQPVLRVRRARRPGRLRRARRHRRVLPRRTLGDPAGRAARGAVPVHRALGAPARPTPAGAGAWRGGLGVETVIELLDDAASLTVRGDRMGATRHRARAAATRPAPGSFSIERADGRVEALAARRPTSSSRGRRASCCAPRAAAGLGDPARDREPRRRVRATTCAAGRGHAARAPPRRRTASSTTSRCTGERRGSLGVDVGGTFTDVVLAERHGHGRTAKVPDHAGRPDRRHRATASGRGARRRRRRRRRGDALRARHHARHQRDPATHRRAGRAGDHRGLRRPAAPRPRGARRGGPLRPATSRPRRPPVDPTAHVRGARSASTRRAPCWSRSPSPQSTTVVAQRRRRSAGRRRGLPAARVRATRRTSAPSPSALRRALPGAFVVCSSDVWPEMREYERAMTTVVSRVRRAGDGRLPRRSEVRAARARHRRRRADHGLGGGVMTAAVAARRPGGDGRVRRRRRRARRRRRRPRRRRAGDVISFDMGGTTAKAGIVRDGGPRSPTTSRSAARAASAAPAPAPASRSSSRSSTSPRSARAAAASPGVDAGGALRVGPRSAGADPGPGVLRPRRHRADGHRRQPRARLPRPRRARRRRDAVARRSPRAAIDDARRRSARRRRRRRGARRARHRERGHGRRDPRRHRAAGIDPRDFALVGFGGAGPMHVSRLADEFGIAHRGRAVGRGRGVGDRAGARRPRRRAPPARSPPTSQHARHRRVRRLRSATLEQRSARAGRRSAAARSTSPRRRMRFRGQVHALDVPLPDGSLEPR